MVLPDLASCEVAEPILRDVERTLKELANRCVQSQLLEGEVYAAPLGNKMCDCGTSLGCLNRQEEEKGKAARVDRRELDKLRSKGWSDAKISRWLEERNKIVARETRVANDRKERIGSLDDPDGWCTVAKRLRDEGVPYVGLLLHWYSGGLTSERIDFQRCDVLLDEKLGATLCRVREDVLYVIR